MNKDDCNKIDCLLRIDIVWQKIEDEPLWSAIVDGNKCTLTMNNFPEEPLYTIKMEKLQHGFG